MKTSRAFTLAAATLILGFLAARWYGVQSPRQTANDATDHLGSGDALTKIIEDPQVNSALQDMQAQFLKKRYAALVKQLNLKPEQAAAFYALLVNHEREQEAVGLQALKGASNPELARVSYSSQRTLDDQIRLLLGENGYTQYKDYNAGMGDRSELKRIQEDFADSPLSDLQQQRLLQLIKSQKEATLGLLPTNFSGKSPTRENIEAVMTQELRREEEIDRRVLQQAADFLSPAQMQILGTSQSNRLSMQRMTTSMMHNVFNGATSNSIPTTP